MKIKKIKIEKNEVFPKGLEINFKNHDKKGPIISYLVSNNGNGKTTILNLIKDKIYGRVTRFGIDIEPQNLNVNTILRYIPTSINGQQDTYGDGVNSRSDDGNYTAADLNEKVLGILTNLRNEDDRGKYNNAIKAINNIFEKAGFKKINYSTSKKYNGHSTMLYNEQIELEDLSDGQKQLFYRFMPFIFMSLNCIENKNGILLFDEPELGFHPSIQTKLKEFLFEIFKDVDIHIIISTHSPYIFSEINIDKEECIKINREDGVAESIELLVKNVPLAPSMNLVNYKVYGISTRELHIELYDSLIANEIIPDNQEDYTEKSSNDKKVGAVSILKTKQREVKFIRSIKFRDKKAGEVVSEPLSIYVRNGIHHTLETNRDVENYLKESIESMLEILKKS